MIGRGASSLALASCCVLVSIACAPATAEDQLLAKFFQAARTLDSSVTTKLATVGFNPRTDGSVQSFQVTAVGPERARSGGVEKEVTIEATVRFPDGTTSSRTMVVTFQRSAVTDPGLPREGRWIITGLRQTPASRTSRATSSVPRS